MKLINMTDYVLEQSKRYFDGHIVLSQYEELTRSYANFLKQPLALWMFVPCDEKGHVLFNPFADDNDAGTEKEYLQIAYNKAKERCLFEGFKLIGSKHVEAVIANYPVVVGVGFKNGINQTIESLTKQDIPLSETAIKSLKL